MQGLGALRHSGGGRLACPNGCPVTAQPLSPGAFSPAGPSAPFCGPHQPPASPQQQEWRPQCAGGLRGATGRACVSSKCPWRHHKHGGEERRGDRGEMEPRAPLRPPAALPPSLLQRRDRLPLLAGRRARGPPEREPGGRRRRPRPYLTSAPLRLVQQPAAARLVLQTAAAALGQATRRLGQQDTATACAESARQRALCRNVPRCRWPPPAAGAEWHARVGARGRQLWPEEHQGASQRQPARGAGEEVQGGRARRPGAV